LTLLIPQGTIISDEKYFLRTRRDQKGQVYILDIHKNQFMVNVKNVDLTPFCILEKNKPS